MSKLNLKTEIGKFYNRKELPQEFTNRLNETFTQFVLPNFVTLHDTNFNFAAIKMARYYHVHLFLDDEGNVYDGCFDDKRKQLNTSFNIAEVWEDGTYRPDGACYFRGYVVVDMKEKMDMQSRRMPDFMWIRNIESEKVI